MSIRRISKSAVALAIATIALSPVAALAEGVPFAKAPLAPVVIDTSKGVDFAQNHSDLLPDPAVRYGKLSNGMTFMIARNTTPPGRATARLRIAAGSMMESDRQRGLAHFLEHIAFKGSKNVPEDEMIRILERHGLAFGADTNAYTTFGETAYLLEIPKVTDETVDTVLFLLREVAGNLTIAPEAIERERGVILGEERVRNTPQTAMGEYLVKKMFAGQKLPDRIPIGTIPVIKTAQRAEFVDFYNAFYRPELATLVVAGDIDPDAIEAKIKAQFGDWKSADAGPIRQTDFGAYANKGLQADTYTGPGLPDSIALSWTRPVDMHYQTVAKVQDDLVSGIALGIVNERLGRLNLRGKARFISASVSRSATANAGESVSLGIVPKPGQDKEAYTQAYTVLRQFVLHGPSQVELDRALANMEVRYKAAVKSEETRGTGGLAGSMLGSIGAGSVVTSASQDYELLRAARPKLTLAAVAKAAKGLLDGDGPFLWHSGEDLKGLDKAALLAGYEAVQNARIDAPVSEAVKPWPYADFAGTAFPVTSRREVPGAGATELTYGNGVRAIIKRTTFAKNSVSVHVRFAGGLTSVSPAEEAPVFAARNIGLIAGGLGKLDGIEINESLAGKNLGINFGIGEDASVMSGGAEPSDLPVLMQLMMAYTTDAAYRPQPFSQFKQSYKQNYNLTPTTPNGALNLRLDALLHSNDPRFVTPTPEEVDKVSLEKARVVVERQLKESPIEITIVGDVSEKDVEAEIARTFAKLPTRAAEPFNPAGAGAVRFPTESLTQSLTHEGRADQSMGYIAWPTTDAYADLKDTAAMRLLGSVIELRLIAQARQEKALTYSPKAGTFMSETFKGYGYISARAEVRPEKLQEFFSLVGAIAEDLKTKPVSADEILRARQPILDSLSNADKNNGYWIGALSGYSSYPRRFEFLQARKDLYAAVTPADLQRLAAKYLVDARALKIQVAPANDKAVRAAPQ